MMEDQEDESGLLTYEFPKLIEHPLGRIMEIAAYSLEYHAKKGRIPNYSALIDALRDGSNEVFRIAKPIHTPLKFT